MASHTLKAACAWKVENGTSIWAGTHAWVQGRTLIFRDCVTLRDANATYVADLILPHNQGWHMRRINDFFVPSDTRLIKSI